MANPWFRLYSEFAHDPKVQMMSEAMQRRYVMLMCMRCSNVMATLRNDEIAFQLRISELELQETKVLFIEKGFIDDSWNLVNWDKRQFKSDYDISGAERQKRYRENKRNALRNVSITLPDTEQIQIQNREEKKNTNAIAPPEGVCDSVWFDFVEQRKSKKAKLTQTALDGIKAESLKAGWSLENALREVCARGWTGFKAEWVADKPPARASPTGETAYQKSKRELWETATGRNSKPSITEIHDVTALALD